jgi:cardiolipin synthase C
MVLCAGCASQASDAARRESHAIAPTAATSLGRALADDVAEHPGESGFQLLTTGSEAFITRIALVQAAERTLDLQYYIVEDDRTGKVLLEEILRAARRGVRVRLLVDALKLGDVDDTLTVLNDHRHIEIRSFNPAATSGRPGASIWGWLTEFERLTKRMHNKSLIADNQAAIVGGRNLGDEYFDSSSDFNFSDIDVLAVGPITAQISNSFDRFWNSPDAVPLAALNVPLPAEEIKRKVRDELSAHWEEVAASKRGNAIRRPQLVRRLTENTLPLFWAKGEVIVDRPEKVRQSDELTQSPPMARLDRLLDRARKEFIAVTPYLVPRDEGVEWLAGMTARGMKVRVLTNSLASTDVSAVHSGYARYRRALVENGVELYEFKPIPGKRTRQNIGNGDSRASLHSKVYVVDRAQVVVASFNLDPRSIELNTELALVIHSPAIAWQVVQMFENTIRPANSYRLVLEGGELVWVTEEKGKVERYHSDPGPGPWRRFKALFFSLMPVEGQL